MKAIALKNPKCNVTNLELIELAKPSLNSSTDVLIKVLFASINPVDYKLANQHFSAWTYPSIIGLDISGVIVELGRDCKKFKIGDHVAVHGNLQYGGGLAEYVVHPEHVLFKLPDGYSLSAAAALPCAGLTAYQALVRKMNIQPKRIIFINGGSGGVGSYAVLIAKKLGLFVITTCSTNKIDYVKQLGADLVIDYTVNDVYSLLKTEFNNKIDYVLETTNKNNLQQDIDVLAFNGQISSIVGIIDTAKVSEFVNGFSFHEVALGGAYLSHHYLSQQDLAKMGQELVALLGDATPQINVYQFDEFANAFLDLEFNKCVGKIVLEV